MFNQTWKKYLPVITILLKRSVNGEQSLKLDHADFERAAGGRKMKWSFPTLQLSNGRIQNSSGKHLALATEMLAELQANEQTNKLLRNQDFEFSMTTDFQLLIRNNTVAAEAVIDDAAPGEINDAMVTANEVTAI